MLRNQAAKERRTKAYSCAIVVAVNTKGVREARLTRSAQSKIETTPANEKRRKRKEEREQGRSELGVVVGRGAGEGRGSAIHIVSRVPNVIASAASNSRASTLTMRGHKKSQQPKATEIKRRCSSSDKGSRASLNASHFNFNL